MNFKLLPTDSKTILALQWMDYEPYYADLARRSLTSDDIAEWLDNWSTLAATWCFTVAMDQLTMGPM